MAVDSLTATVQLVGLADSDAAELDALARSLREELLAVGVDDARPATAGPAPPGTKAGEVLQLGALLVAVAPVALQGVLDAIRHWACRRPLQKVTITIGEDSLALEGATIDQQEQLLQTFLDRHGESED